MPTKCPHCQEENSFYRDYGDDYSCLYCGEIIYASRKIRQEQIDYWRSIIRSKRGRPRKNPLPD